MAPGILTDSSSSDGFDNGSESQYREPLQLSGALDGFKYEDTTPVIGREFFDANIVDDIMTSEERMRDLAITSKFHPDGSCHATLISFIQSHSVASSSFAPRTI